ncbi:MAG: hypothetical protein M3N19_02950 [Candidatus Eremiobacteraeota bacterium]|nr:hypothetical protein [Candidatus Eremiobacteraeota bacterium]
MPLSKRLSSLAFIVGVLVLSGCSQPIDVHSATVRGVGYVRLNDVMKKHPLYGQLAQIDSNIDALGLRALAPSVPKTGADIARETVELNHELENARAQANHQLQQRQTEYAQREQAAIHAALVAAGENPGTAPAQSMQNTAASQAASVTAQANTDFNQYQQAVLTQDRNAVVALSQQLGSRADRQYQQKAEELAAKESQLSLELASRDSSERLSLRTRINNLAMDDTLRAQVKAQLAALDRRESSAVSAMRSRDAATLSAYRSQLRSQTGSEISKQALAIHQQTQAKLQARHQSVSSQVTAQLGALGGSASGSPGRVSPAMQAKIAQIDRQYKAQFQSDVAKTIANFSKTRSDLDARFKALHGVDTTAQSSVAKQLDDLHHQRDQLYSQMLAQVQREVRTIASGRGLKVVFTNVVAPVGGVDLTGDAEKDIESLHE